MENPVQTGLNTKGNLLAHWTTRSSIVFSWFRGMQSCHKRPWSFASFISAFSGVHCTLQQAAAWDHEMVSTPRATESGDGLRVTSRRALRKKRSLSPEAAFAHTVLLPCLWTNDFSKGLWISLGLTQVPRHYKWGQKLVSRLKKCVHKPRFLPKERETRTSITERSMSELQTSCNMTKTIFP